MAPIGLYVHVPFCQSKCPYCDFYSLPYSSKAADDYTQGVLRAISTQPFGVHTADSLYFGGGTPVLLGPERLGRIVSACQEAFGLDLEKAEITVEANPSAVMGPTLAALREVGLNRISLGVQSFQPEELAALGRSHSASQARRAIEDAYTAGFHRITADLMLAIPGQTGDSLKRSIDTLTHLPVSHISAYLLSVEEDTPFGQRRDSLVLPDEDETAQLYLDCVEWLGQAGFAQYEISNFARDGHVARHNLKYWQGKPYLGIGPAAHSYMDGQRFFFPKDLAGFTAAIRPFSLTVEDGVGGGFEETAMLALRLCTGLNLSHHDLPEEAAQRMLAKAKELAAGGLTVVNGSRITLTPAGFLLSNAVTTALLAAAE